MKRGISDEGFQRIVQAVSKRKPKDDEFELEEFDCITCDDPITHTDDPDEEYCEDCKISAAENRRDFPRER